MEKLLYPLQKDSSQSADAFRDSLLANAAPALLALGVKALQLNVVDSAVEAAASLRQSSIADPLDAMFSIWVDSANDRSALDGVLEEQCGGFACYLVTESEPLVPERQAGQRLHGWTQVVYLERPAGMTEADWLEVWKGSHTGIAIETQSTFAYRQNVISQKLSDAGPAIHAIVEESFPDAAMSSPLAFYNVETEDALQARIQQMIESCARFINFERINVVPTSEYHLKVL